MDSLQLSKESVFLPAGDLNVLDRIYFFENFDNIFNGLNWLQS